MEGGSLGGGKGTPKRRYDATPEGLNTREPVRQIELANQLPQAIPVWGTVKEASLVMVSFCSTLVFLEFGKCILW